MIKKDRLLVIGDVMYDVNIFGHSDRLSPEAPVPVIMVDKEEKKLGGAANVAAHMVSAQIRSSIVYKSNKDFSKEDASFEKRINSIGIRSEPLVFGENFPFTIKKRVWSGKQQICRIDEENIIPPDESLALEWLKYVVRLTEENDVKIIILSDYNKGTFSDYFIQIVASYCYDCGIKVILDPKRPTFYKIKGLYAVKPNNRELSSTNLSAEECSKEMGETYLIHTKGKDGMAVYKNGSLLFQCPTVAKEVYDVTGAGDSVNALLGIALYNDMTIQEAVVAANKAASYTLQHIGCYVLTSEEIKDCLECAKNGSKT